MIEIIKADPKVRNRNYLILLVIGLFVVFMQTGYFKNLVTVDRTDMGSIQLMEATLLELFYAQLLNAVWIAIIGFIAIKMINFAIKSLRDKRFPPYNAKTAIDTKILHGKKARLNAYLLMMGAIMMILSPLFRSCYLYIAYTNASGYLVEYKLSELDSQKYRDIWKKRQDDFMLANPKSTQTAYYLYQQGKHSEAKDLINSLVSHNTKEAIFAKHSMNINKELFYFNAEDSIAALDTLCNEYMQPCLFLANYFIEQRDLDKAFSKLDKIKHVEHPEIYSKLRWLYSSKSWSSYNKNKANKYAKFLSKASKPDCDGCSKFSLTKY